MDKYYIFKLNEAVTRKAVTYKNRYGLEIAGELYMAKDFDESKQYPALIVGAPYGGVKEQGPGVYANELARRGFVVLTFDQSYLSSATGLIQNITANMHMIRRPSQKNCMW